MNGMPSMIQPLADTNFHRAEETLAHAFATDPIANFFFPRPAGRDSGLRRMFRACLRDGLGYGTVDTIDEGDAVAVWLRSERATASLLRMLHSGMLTAAFAMGWSATRLFNFLRFIEAEHLHATSSPHWYLFSIAVHPTRQCQGLGSALLRQGLARASGQALPCLLETTNERNLAFYQKHGFRVIREGQLPNGGPHLWFMLAESCSSPGGEKRPLKN
jgi:ribosomal protein S18 acetylase RimI-like enzyme